MACFSIGRTTITAVFVEVEDARVNFRPGTSERTGLRGGWGGGVKFGVDLWDWIPLQLGVRAISPNDTKEFSQLVVDCTQVTEGGPITCGHTPHQASTTSGTEMFSIETGLEPSFRLARALAVSPGLLVGYVGTGHRFTRSIDACGDCDKQDLQVHASAPYVAASLRFTWWLGGIALRYERYLAGDLQDGIAIGLDFGVRYKVAAPPTTD